MIKNYAAYKKTCFTLAFFIITFFGFAQTYTFPGAANPWICPAGVTSVTVEVWGGGGAGGGGGTKANAAGSGGQGGAYVKNSSFAVTPGTSYTIICAGARGGTSGTGTAGAFSSVALTFAPSTVVFKAMGGSTGLSVNTLNGHAAAPAAIAAGNIGGTDYNFYGVNGGVWVAGTPNLSGTGGNSGGLSVGAGGAGGTGVINGSGGASGTAYGGAGGGAYGDSLLGGTGLPGGVVITCNAPVMNVQGNAISIADADATPSLTDGTDFGPTQIVSAPTTKVFTIQNTGAGALTIGAISFSGTNAADFTVTTAPSSSVAAGSSTTCVVTFNPTATGLKTAAISIVNNDAGASKNPYNFSIQGTGTMAFFDSDGDGIFDNVDIDDDNDGILDTSEENYCNLLNGSKVNYKFVNETFGAGTTRTTINTTYGSATTTYTYEGGPGELGDGLYTVGPDVQATAPSWAPAYWYNGLDRTAGDTNGRMGIFNAAGTPGIFYTALITGALPNTPVTYSFWVINLDRTDAPGIGTRIRPNIKVEFRDVNDLVLQTIITADIAPTTAGNAAGDWHQFTANLTFNVSTFKVVFINNNPGGYGNDLAIDDIVITQNLCDRDRDGIADVFDLDSDNDGIPDLVEAGLGNLSAGKGKIAVAWVDANGTGMYDAAEANVALDSDGDGVRNYLDLDSDNDSVFDVDESGAGNTNNLTGYVNGDGDSNGDGTGDGLESETFRSKDTNGDTILEGFGDGILDIYDYGTAANQYGNSGQGIATANASTYLKDTDVDGIPDYLDLLSNASTFDIANNKLIYDYKVLDANNDGILDGTTDIDKDGILDAFDINTAQFGSPRDLHTKLFLDFDGRNDYGQSTAILGGLANASLMAWIDLNPAFSADGVVVGQDNFQIRINSTKHLEATVNGTTVTYPTALAVSQWYNVAATFDGANVKLYLNGALVFTQAKTGAIAADASLLTLGKDPGTSTKYFKGKIDEVRVFNLALTDSQLQRMVYQEIKNNVSEIQGEIDSKNIAASPASLPFANLLRYYRMDTVKDDIIDDLTTTTIDLTGTKIYNHKNIYVQQAPMPFVTARTGNFATAVNSPAKEIRGLDIMDQDWSFVKVLHDITETSDNTDSGMIVNPGIKITMNNDTKIQNDWYLKLDGKIDLVGKSQLLQTTESDLDVTSAGSIERDQQGQASKYNFNYWGSPVGTINAAANNTNFTVAGVLRDGTIPATPAAITWIAGYDGATTPFSLAPYWIYKFDNKANLYANWTQIGETGSLEVGKGFTLKGAGASGSENLTFIGKPNNGTITNTIGIDQLLLVGNPYPSALDAVAFINDNTGSIDGSLYFWESYATNNTHILSDYQGGYATLNLVGGLPAGSTTSSLGVDYISGLGLPSMGAPNRFIPVGQGFFVNGNGAGGTVTFNNSQRSFHKEGETGISNTMFKTAASAKTKTTVNENAPLVTIDTLKKIRLGFNSNNGNHRQVLLGFMNEKATSGMDYGYDAANLDDFPNDMYLLNGENELAIEGEGYFDPTASYPIGVRSDTIGKVSFVLDGLENFDMDQPLFIYDKSDGTYHNIKDSMYEVQLPAGFTNDRFSLRFTDKTLGVTKVPDTINEIQIMYVQNGSTLVINNKTSDLTVQKVTLLNILGQPISNWKTEKMEQQNIQIPIKDISSGIYIAKIKTENGELSRKIIIP